MKTAILMVMVCGSVVVAACGQKGALYLPDKNAAVVTRPAGAESNTPAPPQSAPTPSQQSPGKPRSDDDSQSSKPKS